MTQARGSRWKRLEGLNGATLMKHSPFAVAVCALATAAGCGRSNAAATGPNPACSAFELAITVTVRDSVSGRALANGASGTLHNGATTDTLFHLDSLTLGGGSTVGTYDVTVTRPGYRPWTRTGVQANQTGGPCGSVITVKLTAPLRLAAAALNEIERTEQPRSDAHVAIAARSAAIPI